MEKTNDDGKWSWTLWWLWGTVILYINLIKFNTIITTYIKLIVIL